MTAAQGALFALGLLGILVGCSLLLGLTWMPVWLVPLAFALRRTVLVGLVFALLALTYGSGRSRQEHGRFSRLYLRPLPWPSLFLTVPALTLLAIVGQVLLIERNPHLTLLQYLREELWLVWLLMMPAAALWLGGHQIWLRARATRS